MDINKATADFIRLNAVADIRQLALRRQGTEGVDMPFALDQIAGRQTARTKLPAWAAVDGIVYPPHLSMEQCSGEHAASYKAAVAARLLADRGAGTLTDLTGGFGVDFYYLSAAFRSAVYVERQQALCDIAAANFRLLGRDNATVVCADAIAYLQSMQPVSLIFIDPARRDAAGARTFGIADCTPDVMALKDLLLDKASFVMIKLSPMLDWRKAVDDMGRGVGEVHIVSTGGECKDLLLVLSRTFDGLQSVCCVNDDQVFTFAPDAAAAAVPAYAAPAAGQYLYEPNASVMKAGCFAALSQCYGVSAVAANSHLFVSDALRDDFPGRIFRIDKVLTMNKKELRRGLQDIDRANIAVRNFPLSAPELRRRLKLKDGGDAWIFGTTAGAKQHLLLLCSRIVTLK